MTIGDRVFTASSLQDVLDRITDGVISLDRHWTITFTNDAGERLVSRSGAELVGRNVWEVFPNTVGTILEQRFNEAIDRQCPVFFEQWFEPMRQWFSFRAFPSQTELTVCFRDITESRRTARELAERDRQQAAMAALGTRCLSLGTIELALAEVVRTVAATLRADRVEIVGAPDPDGDPAEPPLVLAADGLDGDASSLGAPLRLPVPGGAGVRELLIYGRLEVDSEQAVRDFLASVAALVSNCARRFAVLREVEFLAQHDPVTALPNRRLLIRHLERVLETAEPHALPPAVLTVAIDRLWLITNSYGHSAGDQLVSALADRIRRVCEPHAMLAQLATELFVLVMDQPTAGLTAERMAASLHAAMREPIRLESGEHFITLSIGIAHAVADSSPVALLRDADTALRLAKPPVRTVVFDERAHDQVLRRAVLDRELHQAVERGELRLRYQPIVDARTRRPVAIEALLRWHHPELGIVPPGEFIGAIEENGLIVPVGSWVLREACEQTARLQREFELPLSVSVNVSARQLADPAFVDRVIEVVADTGLRRGSLELEITESALMEEAQAMGQLLVGFKSHGVRLALDDFGSGYSSLSYLRQLPVDTLKVDRSFVADLGRSADSAIVEAVVKMAHAMGMEVVAEGVEDPTQADTLARLGCERLQGYLFSQPISLDALRTYLQD